MKINLLPSNMKRCFSVCLFLLCRLLSAQNNQFTYPVDTRLYISPPYSPYLDDYGLAGKVQASIRLADPAKSSMQVKVGLKISRVEGGSTALEIKTKANLYLSVEATQVPKILDISPLFIANNLEGGTLNDGAIHLPEGMYNFRLEVFSASDEQLVLANPHLGAQFIQIAYGQSPFLNIPINEAMVKAMPVQNILFQWTPRHLSSFSYNGLPLVYNIRVVELQGVTSMAAAKAEAGAALLSTDPAVAKVKVNRDGLLFPYYQLNQIDLPLTVGAYYAWQVTVSTGNTSTRQYFSDEGRSTPYVFMYESECPRVTGATLSLTSEGYNELYWPTPLQPNTNNPITGYNILYKPTNGGSDWVSLPFVPTGYTQANVFLLKNQLVANTFYEIAITTQCSTNVADQTYVGAAKNIPVNCDAGPQQIVVDELTPPSATDKKITWERVTGAQYYTIDKFKDGVWSHFKGTQEEAITATDYVLVPQAGATKYRVSAYCSNGKKLGGEFNLNLGYQGVCAVPLPLSFSIVPSTTSGSYDIAWQGAAFYSGYIFKYRLKAASPGAFTSVNVPKGDKPSITLALQSEMEYDYQIAFTCTPTSTVETVLATFKTPAPVSNLVDPLTGDCFPPAHTLSEVKTASSCQLSWDKVAGADKYTVYYTLEVNKAQAESLWVKSDETSSTRITLTGLTANAKYVYYVKVKCTSGLPSIASETQSFDLGQVPDTKGTCPKVTDFDATSTTENSIGLAWLLDPSPSKNTSYEIQYRDTQDPVTLTHRASVNDLSGLVDGKVSKTLISLKPNRSYEILIQAACGTDKADKSLYKTFTTKAATSVSTEKDFQCGNMDNAPQPDMATCGQKALAAGATFKAGEFEIVVDHALPPIPQGEPSVPFTFGQRTNATGTMLLPYANFAPVAVKLQNVEIDKDGRMCRGQVALWKVTIYPAGKDAADQIAAYRKKLADAIKLGTAIVDNAETVVDASDKYFSGGGNVGNAKTGETPTPTITSNTGDQNSIQVNNGQVTVSGASGSSGAPTVVQVNNQLYHASMDGTVTKIGKKDASFQLADTLANFQKGTVVFGKHASSKFDFDEYQTIFKDKRRAEQEYEVLNKVYYVPSQFIVPYEKTTVTAIATGQLNKNNISFITRKGFKYEPTWTGDTCILSLVGGPHGDAQEIYAIYKEAADKTYTVGKLLLPAYNVVQRNVMLVPVGNIKTTVEALKNDIQTKLNTTYHPVGVKYTVTVAEAFNEVGSDGKFVWDLNKDDKLQDKGSTLFSNDYTGEERALVQTYLSKYLPTPDPETAYLFMLNEVAGGTATADLLGKMPQQEQMGFIFIGSGSTQSGGVPTNKEAITRTVAHELAHGVHFLDHTFAEGLKIDPHTTCSATVTKKDAARNKGNLMDYDCPGVSLYKYQWDQIHDPGHVWGVFKRDDDVELKENTAFDTELMTIPLPKELSYASRPKECNSYLTKNGNLVSFDKLSKDVTTKISKLIFKGDYLAKIIDVNGNVFDNINTIKLNDIKEDQTFHVTKQIGATVTTKEAFVCMACVETEAAKPNSTIIAYQALNHRGTATSKVYTKIPNTQNLVIKFDAEPCQVGKSYVGRTQDEQAFQCKATTAELCEEQLIQVENCTTILYTNPVSNLSAVEKGENTLGKVVLNYLNTVVQANANISKDLTKLEDFSVNGEFVLTGTTYGYGSMRSAIKPQLQELNAKLTLLKKSTGIDFYVHFIDSKGCLPDLSKSNEFAASVFTNSNIDKAKGIYVAVFVNQGAYQIGIKVGSEITNEQGIRNVLTENFAENISLNAGKGIIAAYRAIPKNAVVYKFVLYPKDPRKTGKSVFNTSASLLTVPDLGGYFRRRTTQKNYLGDVVAAEFFVYDPFTGKATEVKLEKYVKEDFVEKSAFRLALTVGAKKLDYKTVVQYVDTRHAYTNDHTTISECELSLGENCDQQFKNNVVLGTSATLGLLNGSTEFALLLTAGEVVYYHITDQDELVAPTLVGFGLGASVGPLIKAAASTYTAASKAIKLGSLQIAQYYTAYKLSTSALDLATLDRLYNLTPSKDVVEILLKESTGNPTFVKIVRESDGSYKALVGELTDDGAEITKAANFGSNQTYDLTKVTDQEVETLGRQIIQDVTNELTNGLGQLEQSLRDWRYGKNDWTWPQYFENLKINQPANYEVMLNEALARNTQGLTKSEAYSIFSMTTIFHQVPLNSYLRKGQMITKVTDAISVIDDALTKLPVVPANTKYYRGIKLAGDDLTTFLQNHRQGGVVEYSDYIFAANNRPDSFIEDLKRNIKITIVTKPNSAARTIWDFSFGKIKLDTKNEVMFSRGSKFEVSKLEPRGDDVFEIELLEK